MRSVTLGPADRMSVAEARRVLASLLDEPEQGRGAKHPGRPMSEFAEEFLERYSRHQKRAALESSAHALRKHILPALGHLSVDEVGVEHVRDWFASLADRPATANRSMPALSVMMCMAEHWGYRPHNSNPCRNTRRYKTPPKERFLAPGEMARLNAVLTRDEFHCPREVAVIRLLLLTGCRRSEVHNLRWRNVGTDALKLVDSKVGPRTVPLGAAARAHIDTLTGARDSDAFLFERLAEGRGTCSLTECWYTVRERARLGRLRLHDMQHTVASHAVMSGENLPQVGKLLGHRRHRTTAGYAHLADGHLVEAAERVGASSPKRWPDTLPRGNAPTGVPLPCMAAAHFRPRRCDDCRSTPGATAPLELPNKSR